jgi:hypothetical protein
LALDRLKGGAVHEAKTSEFSIATPVAAPAPSAPASVQRSLTVGAADNRYESEADATAREVVDRLNSRGTDSMPVDGLAGRGSSGSPDVAPVRRQSLRSFETSHRPPAPTQLPVDQINRSAVMVQRFWPFTSKKDDPKKKEFTGKGGALPSVAEEVGKPTVAGGFSAGVGVGTKEAMQHAGNAGAHAGMAAGGSLGLGVLLAGDAAMGLMNASAMDDEADLYGDDAMKKAAARKKKDQSWALAGGLAATGKGAAQVAHAAGGAGMAGATAAAAGTLGVVGGTAMVIQGAWRGGKAIQKYCRLTWGRGQEMLSSAGKYWKSVIVGSEKFKIAINGLKIAAGALGIAAGVLAIVSNPVGWAVGLAALIAGGVYAVGKIAAKVSNAKDKSKAADKVDQRRKDKKAQPEISGPQNVSMNGGGGPDLAAMGYSAGSVKQAGPQNAKQRGTGYKDAITPMQPSGPKLDSYGMDVEDQPERMDPERQEAIERANEIAQEGSENARVAAAMIDALSHGDKDFVAAHIEARANDPKWDLGVMKEDDDRQLYDAFMLLSSINVTPEEALAATGQDLIEKKLSKAEAM